MQATGESGGRKYAFAFLLGAVSTLSLPPLGAVFIFLLTVPAFAALTSACATRREAFLAGWAFGGGYFIIGFYWISFALTVDLKSFGWVIPLSAILGPGVFALYYGFIPLAACRWRENAAAHALATALAWAAIEWLRGHAFTGFPWNLPSYGWHRVPPVLQINSLIGAYGLTLVTLLWAMTPVFWRHGQKKAASALVFSFLAAFLFGAWHLHSNPPSLTQTPLRIVQPNIPQSLKWEPSSIEKNFQHLLRLTNGAEERSLVVWPETAVIADAAQLQGTAARVARVLKAGSFLLTGALYMEGGNFYNSLLAFDAAGKKAGFYAKHHLVPFGEYIPFREYLNLTPVAAGIAMVGDFTPGGGIATLSLSPPGHLPKVSPLVCYEVIFPGAVASADDRPDWLANVTNDAWYGHTAGPHQHFEIARVRAIEEGLPLARAANTGISGIIDPLGRVVAQLPLGSEGVIDARLPAPLAPTPYARFGDLPFFALMGLLGLAVMACRGRR